MDDEMPWLRKNKNKVIFEGVKLSRGADAEYGWFGRGYDKEIDSVKIVHINIRETDDSSRLELKKTSVRGPLSVHGKEESFLFDLEGNPIDKSTGTRDIEAVKVFLENTEVKDWMKDVLLLSQNSKLRRS